MDTLGPFGWLLLFCIKTLNFGDPEYNKEVKVWRGCFLEQNLIETYIQKSKCNQKMKAQYYADKNEDFKESELIVSWDSFISTTRSKEVAKRFGNILFEISTSYYSDSSYGLNLESISVYPEEEEVLLPPTKYRVTFHYEYEGYTIFCLTH
ncbi:hypothetical protein FGO68_gene13548 [Halteria grandinella]|uniref:NAD(P)(+)--arginine ADP-ribosyltransferase n=1 Tax=Halteria grandinella TaxID=5974 RepID=A0A8J8T1B8_HALGN|nr:hypothetical protein FGO68_gene13548 [Halteria grandinella]